MEEKKPEKKKNITDYILTVILIIAVGVFCYASYKLFTIYMEYKEATDEYNQIAQMAVTVREPEEEKIMKEESEKESTVKGEPVEGIAEESGEQIDELEMYEAAESKAEAEMDLNQPEEKQENMQAADSNAVQVLTKPDKQEIPSEKSDMTGKAEDTKDTEAEDIIKVPLQQKELAENLQRIVRKISFMKKEDALSANLVEENDVLALLTDRAADVILPYACPSVWVLKKLADSMSTVYSSLKIAADIRENGPGIEVPLEVNFELLQGINEDVIGWIYMEAIDTINYPIVKGEDNDKYLHHTYEGKYNFAGTIFIDYENSRDFSDCNTLVYGHNMKNGSMFGQLKNFVSKPETYENSKYFWILTPEADYRYEIIAAYTTEVKSDTYTLFTSPGRKYLDYIDKIRDWSAIETTERQFTVRDKIVTLSTCTGNDSTRFVVQGIRVNTISK